MEILFKLLMPFLFFGFITLLVAVFGWFSEASKKVNENEFNRVLLEKLEGEKIDLEYEYSQKKKELDELVTDQLNEIKRRDEDLKRRDEDLKRRDEDLKRRDEYLKKRDLKFKEGYLKGRKWLAEYIAESEEALDEMLSHKLKTKWRPARKAAEEISNIKSEKRKYKQELTFLKYQLKCFIEYFPILEEYQDAILDEAVELDKSKDNFDELESIDPVRKYIPKSEFDALPPARRNQLALDKFLARKHSQSLIGKIYERYLGYLYERDGWEVKYFGIIEGHFDLGRDLICKKGNETHLIQAKCWSLQKTIHEKHIFQLFGTMKLYQMKLSNELPLFTTKLKAIFITTTNLSDVARKAAEVLDIEVKENFELQKTYPMIKCNISQKNQEKIYHLPFDQQYDKVIITPEKGECYVTTTEEAESLGFRRAFRFKGNNQEKS